MKRNELVKDVSKDCFYCHRNFHVGESIYIKIPEIVCLCLSCCERNKDDESRGWLYTEYDPRLHFTINMKDYEDYRNGLRPE